MGSGKANNKSFNKGVTVQHAAGSRLVFTAAPDTYSMVSQWLVNDVPQSELGNELTIGSLAGPTTVEVSFEELKLYKLPGNGTGYTVAPKSKTPAAPGDVGEIRHGGNVSFVVAPVAGYRITALTIAGIDCLRSSGSPADITENIVSVDSIENGAYTITLRNVTKDIAANITTAEVGSVVTILSTTNGSIEVKAGETPVTNGKKLPAGTELTVTALPAEGYVLSSWTNSLSGTANPATLTIPDDGSTVTIGATFAEKASPPGPGPGPGPVEPEMDIRVSTPLDSALIASGEESDLDAVTGRIKAAVTLESLSDGSTALDVLVQSDGKPIYDLPGGIVVRIPLTGSSPQVAALLEDGSIAPKSIQLDDYFYVLLEGSAKLKIQSLDVFKFTDIRGHWADEVIRFTAARELFQGFPDGSFAPNAPMTRAMMATVLWRLEQSPDPEENESFADVSPDAWYGKAVAWAKENEVILGTEKGFEPDQNITREQLAALFYRLAQAQHRPGKNTELPGHFLDADSISPWAKDAVSWAVDSGLLVGYENKLNPKNMATRAEVAAMLQRFVVYLVK